MELDDEFIKKYSSNFDEYKNFVKSVSNKTFNKKETEEKVRELYSMEYNTIPVIKWVSNIREIGVSNIKTHTSDSLAPYSYFCKSFIQCMKDNKESAKISDKFIEIYSNLNKKMGLMCDILKNIYGIVEINDEKHDKVFLIEK